MIHLHDLPMRVPESVPGRQSMTGQVLHHAARVAASYTLGVLGDRMLATRLHGSSLESPPGARAMLVER